MVSIRAGLVITEVAVNELALFAGAGGGILGTRLLGWRCICGVEIDPYCREILLRRQEEGHLEPFPIWDNARTFDGKAWAGKVDVITAGFPCQPFSAAGKNEGEHDPRNMWPDTIRIIREVGPRFCLLENVPNLLVHEYFGTIIGQLQESGYCVRWRVISAAEMGAPHLRDRVWIMANADGCGCSSPRENKAHKGSANRSFAGRQRSRENPWKPEPRLGRVADGVADRVDRLAGAGNGQVPDVVKAAWMLLGGEADSGF